MFLNYHTANLIILLGVNEIDISFVKLFYRLLFLPQLQIEMQPFRFQIECNFLNIIFMPSGCILAYKKIGFIPVFFVLLVS